jgi:hypothetical protein
MMQLRSKSLSRASHGRKKIALIEESNPRWNDLAWDWFGPEEIIGFADDSASRATQLLRFIAAL